MLCDKVKQLDGLQNDVIWKGGMVVVRLHPLSNHNMKIML